MRQQAGAVLAALVAAPLLVSCASPFGADVSYCEAVTTLQHRYADARAMEMDADRSASVLEDAFNQVELQSEVVRDAAPGSVRDDWAAVARPGDATEQAQRAFAHADAECATGLQAIADGLTPAEADRYGSAGS